MGEQMIYEDISGEDGDSAVQETAQYFDAELLAMARQGEAESFGEWWCEKGGEISKRAAQFRGNYRCDAEDIAQNTALAVWRNLCKGTVDLREPDSLDRYVQTAAANQALSYRKVARRRGQHEDFIDDHGDEASNLPAKEPTPEDTVMRALTEDKSAAALLAYAKPQYRGIIYDRYVAGYSVEEVMARRGVNKNAVLKHCFRGLQTIREGYLAAKTAGFDGLSADPNQSE